MTKQSVTKSRTQEPAETTAPLAVRSEFPFLLSRMRGEFDRLIDRLFHDWSGLWHGTGWRWGLEVRDEDEAVVVEAEAPGFEPQDFDLQVSDNRLVLRAAKTVQRKDEKGQLREYREEKCYESVTLPADIDRDKVEARYHNGILTITMPKTAASKARHIEVKAS
ncbi:MAG: Hsp20/alpha crystallin family protein [Pirellulales bacterium]|jgi:HSP20 family protein|nr:Hsp20/alpha crystallin family protein [Pirellulales bacterium]